MKTLTSLLLAGSLTSLPGVAQARSTQDHYKTKVSVEVSTLAVDKEPNHARDVRETVDTDILGPLRAKHGLVLVSDGTPPATLTITIEWKDFSQSLYTVKLAAQTPTSKPVSKEFEFQGLEYELSDRLKQEIPTILAWLEVSEAPPSPSRHEPNPADETPPLKAINRTEAIGLGLGIGGVVLLVPSVVVLANRATRNAQTNADTEDQELKRGVFVASVVGVALGTGLAIGGIGTFVYGRRAKKKRATGRVTPVLGPSHAGIAFATRF